MPVQSPVLQYLQGADVLGGQEVVEGAQALAEFDVYSSVPYGSLHHALCCPLVAGGHFS